MALFVGFARNGKTKYPVYVSTRREKKYMALVDGRTIHFGQIGYEQYKDRFGVYRDWDHNDKKRRANYRSRHRKPGPPGTASWLSWHYLW